MDTITDGELRSKLEAHRQWLSGRGGERFELFRYDLRDSDLSGCNLRDSDLSGCNLHGCNLRDSDLRYCNLHGCNLRDSDLRYCNLHGCNLHGCNLRYCNLHGCNLRDSDLRYCNLHGCNLRGCDLRGCDLRYCNLRGCIGLVLLPACDLRGYSFPHAVLCGNEWRVRVGCRDFSIADAREHWGPSYRGDREQGDIYLLAIDWLDGWIQRHGHEHTEQDN